MPEQIYVFWDDGAVLNCITASRDPVVLNDIHTNHENTRFELCLYIRVPVHKSHPRPVYYTQT